MVYNALMWESWEVTVRYLMGTEVQIFYLVISFLSSAYTVIFIRVSFRERAYNRVKAAVSNKNKMLYNNLKCFYNSIERGEQTVTLHCNCILPHVHF